MAKRTQDTTAWTKPREPGRRMPPMLVATTTPVPAMLALTMLWPGTGARSSASTDRSLPRGDGVAEPVGQHVVGQLGDGARPGRPAHRVAAVGVVEQGGERGR